MKWANLTEEQRYYAWSKSFKGMTDHAPYPTIDDFMRKYDMEISTWALEGF